MAASLHGCWNNWLLSCCMSVCVNWVSTWDWRGRLIASQRTCSDNARPNAGSKLLCSVCCSPLDDRAQAQALGCKREGGAALASAGLILCCAVIAGCRSLWRFVGSPSGQKSKAQSRRGCSGAAAWRRDQVREQMRCSIAQIYQSTGLQPKLPCDSLARRLPLLPPDTPAIGATARHNLCLCVKDP